jgi:hypothetical protein
VSLGSSTRDKSVETSFAGYKVQIHRVGCDGDKQKVAYTLRECDADPKVDAIALGGIDLLWEIEGKRYVVREARKLAEVVKNKPVVCGFGVKTTLELERVAELFHREHLRSDQRVLFLSLAERYAMGRMLWNQGCPMIFGDLLFVVGVPIPIRKLTTARTLARLLLPVARQMPIRFFYPQGEKQQVRSPRHERYFAWADVVAGDFLLIKKFAPYDMRRKTILTNTTTEEDRAMLVQSGVHKLITTTPRIQGRSFGANVWEGLLAAVLVDKAETPSPENYSRLLERHPLEPNLEILNP